MALAPHVLLRQEASLVKHDVLSWTDLEHAGLGLTFDAGADQRGEPRDLGRILSDRLPALRDRLARSPEPAASGSGA